MPLYVVQPDSLNLEQTYEESPTVALLTDCASENDLPFALREVSDRVEKGNLSILCDNKLPGGVDAAFLWLAGESLLEGAAAGLRRAIASPGSRSFVAVHLPCFAEVDLIGLQPRLWRKGPNLDNTQPGVRIAGALLPPPELEGFLQGSSELWPRLYSALLDEQRRPGNGLDLLSQLWHARATIPKLYAALLVRNLIVLLIRHNRYEEAEKLLNLGMDYYPRYAELPYLAALLCASKERYSEIPAYVRRATQNPDRSYVGSGGEGSYRSLWLLGWVFELAGNQAMALRCYLPGAQACPAYPPSVFGILRQRLPRNVAQQMRYKVLGALARRESQYLEMIVEYFLLHRQVEAARRMLESSQLPDATRERLQESVDEAIAAFRPTPRGTGVKPGVTLVGPFYVHSSLARINREIAAALAAANELEVSFEPHGFGEVQGASVAHFDAVSKGFKQRVQRLDLTIRQHWPPDFQPPASGKLVVLLPWEYGSIPMRWADQIRKCVDELWVPSEFCREVFVRGGVPANKIQVIPYGVDAGIFRPDEPAWRPAGCRSFVFLFVGGAIARKGIDVLWNAYCRAFTSDDDVTLVIKDIGSSTFYKGMTLLEQLSRASQDIRSPQLVVLTEQFDDSKLASLYRGSNTVVLPYRGEGFGMPLAEGLACGRPVITTGLGPAREFCPPVGSYFVSATESQMPSAPLRFGPMSGPFTWFEPDVAELSRAMRWVFEHRGEAARRGKCAGEKVRAALNWPRITNLQLERIRHLVGA